MVLICYRCTAKCSSIDKYLSHLRLFHGIELSGYEVLCGQNSCPRRFACFKPLRRHLVQHMNSGNVAEIDFVQEPTEIKINNDENIDSKLVEMEELYPSSESKLRLAGFLADVTGLPSTALFDSDSHRGYVNKFLDNLRAKQSPSKRRYSWKKKEAQVAVSACSTVGGGVQSDPTSSNTPNQTNPDGCYRGLANCNLCQGMATGLLPTYFHNKLKTILCTKCNLERKVADVADLLVHGLPKKLHYVDLI